MKLRAIITAEIDTTVPGDLRRLAELEERCERGGQTLVIEAVDQREPAAPAIAAAPDLDAVFIRAVNASGLFERLGELLESIRGRDPTTDNDPEGRLARRAVAPKPEVAATGASNSEPVLDRAQPAAMSAADVSGSTRQQVPQRTPGPGVTSAASEQAATSSDKPADPPPVAAAAAQPAAGGGDRAASEPGGDAERREQRPWYTSRGMTPEQIVATYVGGASVRETARVCGCAENTVEVLLDKAGVERRSLSETMRAVHGKRAEAATAERMPSLAPIPPVPSAWNNDAKIMLAELLAAGHGFEDVRRAWPGIPAGTLYAYASAGRKLILARNAAGSGAAAPPTAERASVDAAVAAGQVQRLPSAEEIAQAMRAEPALISTHGAVEWLKSAGHKVTTGPLSAKIDGKEVPLKGLIEYARSLQRQPYVRKLMAASQTGAAE